MQKNSGQVTVVICTYNRGEAILPTVHSILNRQQFNELLIIDQSTDNQTLAALSRFDAGELRIISSSRIGVSVARNIALHSARNDLVLFTDDDCFVGSKWVEVMANELLSSRNNALVYSTVKAAKHDEVCGFVPTYHCRHSRNLTAVWQRSLDRAIGPSMGVCRNKLIQLGGFDERLGAGAAMAGEDAEIALRALANGYDVRVTNKTYVVHDGFYDWKSGSSWGRFSWIGIGASIGKISNTNKIKASQAFVLEIIIAVFLLPLKQIFKGKFPRGLLNIIYLIYGFYIGRRDLRGRFISTSNM